MASWVTPTVAAEMWEMSVAEIQDRVKRGELVSKEEGGFTFVNIGSPDESSSSPARITPPTFSIVTREEQLALHESTSIAEARQLISQTRRRPVAA